MSQRGMIRGEVAWVDAGEGLAEEGRGWEDREREVWEDEHPERARRRQVARVERDEVPAENRFYVFIYV